MYTNGENGIRTKFIESQVECFGDKKIISFIADKIFRNEFKFFGSNQTSLAFAMMLKERFFGGRVCVCYPSDNVVFVYEGVAYDCSGVSIYDCEMYIPVEWYYSVLNNLVKSVKNIDFAIFRMKDYVSKNLLAVKALNRSMTISYEILSISRAIAEKDFSGEFSNIVYQYWAMSDKADYEVDHGIMDRHEANEAIVDFCFNRDMYYPVIKRMINQQKNK